MLQSASIITVSRAPARATAAARPSLDLSFVRRFFGVIHAAVRARAELEHLSPRSQRDAAQEWLRTEETRERR